MVWYTSLVPHKHIAKVFQSKYPGIEIDVYRAARGKVPEFERWYPEKGMTTEEYEKRADGWLQLLQEITRN